MANASVAGKINASEERMEFSSDESDIEHDTNGSFQQIPVKPRKLSLKNRSSSNLTGIQNLPPEIMFSILQFIEVPLLMNEVKFISRYFYDFLTSTEFWEMRLGSCLSSFSGCSDVFLKVSDVELEQMNKVGIIRSVHELECGKSLSYNTSVVQHRSTSNHYGDIHCVKILTGPASSTAISGSRDKTICIYDLKLLPSKDDCVVNTNTDHNGWIWTIDQEDGISSRVCSGSWDSFVHFYELGRGDLEMITKLPVHSAVLCTRYEPNFLIYGTYSKFVSGYDVRSETVVWMLKHHTKPVLSVTSSDNYIWSTGEDHALACYDRRAGKLFKRIKMERISSAIQFDDPYLWVAGYDGFVKRFSQDMKIISKFDTGHTAPILDMTHTNGATVTACKDGAVKIFSPNFSAVQWNSFSLGNSASCVDYKDGIVMAGCCDSTVTFWRNNTRG